jgi:putative flippase GtrA
MTPAAPVLRFVGTGLLNSVFGYGVYALLIIAGAPVWAAVGGATVLGIIFNFFSYGGLVFGNASFGRLPAFIAVYAVLYVLNVGLVHMVMAWGAGALLAQAFVFPLMAALAFLLMRVFVFGNLSNGGRRRVQQEAQTEQPGRGQP